MPEQNMVLSMSISDDGERDNFWSRNHKKLLIAGGATLCVAVLLVVLYAAGVFDAAGSGSGHNDGTTGKLSPPNVLKPLPPSLSSLHIFRKAAVCADGPPCAEIGKQILLRNGSAVDATIAALFCNGLVNMQSMGIGGGFLMTVYKKSEGKAYSLNARETAPKLATSDMFMNRSQRASKKGGLSIGIPGELRGYWAAHQKFGRLPWKELILPSIALCDEGYKISVAQKNAMNMSTNLAKGLYKEWFFHENGRMKKAGDLVRPRELCKTLRIIAELGADDFYTGSIASQILEDLKRAGSIITAEDLANYKVQWQEPITIDLSKGERLFSAPLPGSGVLLAYILKILDGYGFTRQNIDGINNTVLTYHRMIEAFKHAYARRTELGDTDFVDIQTLISNLLSPEYAEHTRMLIDDTKTNQNPMHYGAIYYDHTGQNGTAHISVLSEEGDAVSVTSTVNLYFGSEVISEQTGVTFNSVMDDFSTPGMINYFGLPGSPNNAIAPGKRPLSSMSPSIMIDQAGDVLLVIGASGGTQITTGAAQVISRLLWFDQNIKEAVDAPRIHHQLFPMSVGYEYGTLQQIVDGLQRLGHNTTRLTAYSVVCALMKKGENLFANADHRKGGDVYGIN